MFRSTKAVLGSVVAEYAGAELGDERRNKRLEGIARRLEADPRSPFPHALHSTAELDAFDAQDILEPHRNVSFERASRAGTVLVVHDTTAAEFPGRRPRQGLGVTTEGKHGVLAHAALAVDLNNMKLPLGVVGLNTFTRTGTKWRESKKTRSKVRDDPERESLRWWDAVLDIETARKNRFEAIHVMDAEADFYELFCQMCSNDARFVVRVGQQKRSLKDDEGVELSLRDVADGMKPKARRKIELTSRQYAERRPRNQLKKHPPREGRFATVAIASAAIELPRTKYSAIKGGDVKLNLVRVWEPKPPAGALAVEWLLFTTEPEE